MGSNVYDIASAIVDRYLSGRVVALDIARNEIAALLLRHIGDDVALRPAALSLVCAERVRQFDKYGVQDHAPEKWVVILGEEFGEVCRAVYDKDPANYVEELSHVAAVAVQMIEAHARTGGKGFPGCSPA